MSTIPSLFPKNPYPNGNYTVTDDFLEQLILLTSGEVGRCPISEADGGYEDLSVEAEETIPLTVPAEAVAATIAVEVNTPNVTIPLRVARYKINGEPPTEISGFALGDTTILELYGRESLLNFLVMGIAEELVVDFRVQYYKSAKTILQQDPPAAAGSSGSLL